MSETAQIEIVKDDSLSINDLIGLQAEGFSVIRSAHAGNLSPYNLTLVSLGIPTLLVDHTITGALDPDLVGVDRNYFPEAIKTQGNNQVIARAGRIACRAPIEEVPDEFKPLIGGVTFVDEAHVSSIEHVFPGQEIFTNTEYLREHESIVGEIINLALDTQPELFDRVVSPEGEVSRTPLDRARVNYMGILQLKDDPRAEERSVLLPNEVELLANFLIEALTSGQSTQYHLSGPDMVQYMFSRGMSPMKKVNELLERVRSQASFRREIPGKTTVKLVPTAEARLATTMKRKPKLVKLLASFSEAQAELTSVRELKKAFFASPAASDPEAKEAFLKCSGDSESQACRVVASDMAEIPELFIGPKQIGFISQYDVAREGGLFIADENLNLSMAAISGIFKSLQAMGKRVPK